MHVYLKVPRNGRNHTEDDLNHITSANVNSMTPTATKMFEQIRTVFLELYIIVFSNSFENFQNGDLPLKIRPPKECNIGAFILTTTQQDKPASCVRILSYLPAKII